MDITNKEVEQLAALSKLEICEEEKHELVSDIDEMVKSFKVIKEADTEDIEEMINVHQFSNVFRDDVITNDDGKKNQDMLLENAPNKKDGFIIVPKMKVGSDNEF